MTTPSPAPRPELELALTELNEFQTQVDELNTQVDDLDTSLGHIADALTQTDPAALWSAVAAWLAAGITVFLARYAWKAWKAASQQVSDQIWGRQIEALARYLAVLQEFLDATPMQHWELNLRAVSEEEFRAKREHVTNKVESHARIERDLQTTGAIWRMLHKDDAVAAKTLKEAEEAIVLGFGAFPAGGCDQESWERALAGFIESLQLWQVAEDKQQEATDILEFVEGELGVATNPNGRK